MDLMSVLVCHLGNTSAPPLLANIGVLFGMENSDHLLVFLKCPAFFALAIIET